MNPFRCTRCGHLRSNHEALDDIHGDPRKRGACARPDCACVEYQTVTGPQPARVGGDEA